MCKIPVWDRFDLASIYKSIRGHCTLVDNKWVTKISLVFLFSKGWLLKICCSADISNAFCKAYCANATSRTVWCLLVSLWLFWLSYESKYIQEIKLRLPVLMSNQKNTNLFFYSTFCGWIFNPLFRNRLYDIFSWRCKTGLSDLFPILTPIKFTEAKY